MTDTIKTLNDNDMYVATIKLYSRGNSEEVATIVEVSHALDDDFQGEIPASYGVAREIMLGIQANTVMYAATKADQDFLSDPAIPDEAKVQRILESSQAQEEAINATIN